MADTKEQKPSKGLKERMQDVYFEFLPPILETQAGKTVQQSKHK